MDDQKTRTSLWDAVLGALGVMNGDGRADRSGPIQGGRHRHVYSGTVSDAVVARRRARNRVARRSRRINRARR